MTKREIECNFSADLDFFHQIQLSAYIRSQFGNFTTIHEPSVFEQLCLKGEPLRHSLSHFYALMIEYLLTGSLW